MDAVVDVGLEGALDVDRRMDGGANDDDDEDDDDVCMYTASSTPAVETVLS